MPSTIVIGNNEYSKSQLRNNFYETLDFFGKPESINRNLTCENITEIINYVADDEFQVDCWFPHKFEKRTYSKTMTLQEFLSKNWQEFFISSLSKSGECVALNSITDQNTLLSNLLSDCCLVFQYENSWAKKLSIPYDPMCHAKLLFVENKSLIEYITNGDVSRKEYYLDYFSLGENNTDLISEAMNRLKKFSTYQLISFIIQSDKMPVNHNQMISLNLGPCVEVVPTSLESLELLEPLRPL